MSRTADLFAPPQASLPEIDDGTQLQELWPRQHAAEIMRLPRAERLAALHQVPPHLQAWVKHYVRDWTRRRNTMRRQAAREKA